MQEAIALSEEVVGKKMNVVYKDDARSGDHIWYVSDVRKFRSHYPEWNYSYGLRDIIEQIADSMTRRTG
jgi:CDP-paratose 2-epimerase